MHMPNMNIFRPEIWEPGALDREIERCLAAPVDLYASGRWQPSVGRRQYEKYKTTLRGLAPEHFDPDGYLTAMGLPRSLTAGRTSAEMLRAFHLIGSYRPDTRYFPLPERVAVPVQKNLLRVSRWLPRPFAVFDRRVHPLVVRMLMKKTRSRGQGDGGYGSSRDIDRGERSPCGKSERYLGIVRRQAPQYAWGRCPHMGRMVTDRDGGKVCGTYDIALKFGFSEIQAARIARACFDVDLSRTHYRDPDHPARRRITGTAGGIGDFHRHYNLSAPGDEDTRITAARIHLDRSLELAGTGYYNAAERELGIGLHSLQDIFSHAQVTPLVHTLIGEFPDRVQYHPLAMYETALATEGYIRHFIDRLNVAEPVGSAGPAAIGIRPDQGLIGGNATPAEKSKVRQRLSEFPAALAAFLKKSGIGIYIAARGTLPTDLGFGMDLDRDGRITPGKWVDLDRDGRKQWYEVEDRFDGSGRAWCRQLAGYHHGRRMIFISAGILDGPAFERVLKHEIAHAIDATLQEDPRKGQMWSACIARRYEAARRRGDIAFDAIDPHEYFAASQSVSRPGRLRRSVNRPRWQRALHAAGQWMHRGCHREKPGRKRPCRRSRPVSAISRP